jgi:hypothetical protein
VHMRCLVIKVARDKHRLRCLHRVRLISFHLAPSPGHANTHTWHMAMFAPPISLTGSRQVEAPDANPHGEYEDLDSSRSFSSALHRSLDVRLHRSRLSWAASCSAEDDASSSARRYGSGFHSTGGQAMFAEGLALVTPTALPHGTLVCSPRLVGWQDAASEKVPSIELVRAAVISNRTYGFRPVIR